MFLKSNTHKSKYLSRCIHKTLAITCLTGFAYFANAADMTKSPKYRAAPEGEAVKQQYIVVLNDDAVEQNAESSLQLDGLDRNTLTRENLINYRRDAISVMTDGMTRDFASPAQHKYHRALSGFSATLNEAELAELLNDPRVDYIAEDQQVYLDATQNNAPYGLDRIDQANLPLNSTYNYDHDGTDVDVYIIDSGINGSHGNFGGRVSQGINILTGGRGDSDEIGHGTFVAGVVGANTWGVAKDVNLVPVRVFGDSVVGTEISDIVASVEWVMNNASGDSVVNMSLAINGSTANLVSQAVDAAIDEGITFVVSAGNSFASDSCDQIPASVSRALTVAASNAEDERATFSNVGSCVDVYAPGEDIRSTSHTGGTLEQSGTSFSAPLVAGVAAQYLDANPNAQPAEVATAIIGSSVQGRISDVQDSANRLLQVDFDNSPISPPSGWTNLQFRHSGRCLDLTDGITTRENTYQQWNCSTGNLNQRFSFTHLGDGWYSLKNQKSDRCIDVAAGNQNNGGTIWQWNCNNNNINQAWRIADRGNGWFELISKNSGLCLDMKFVRIENGGLVHQYQCLNSDNQQFRFVQ